MKLKGVRTLYIILEVIFLACLVQTIFFSKLLPGWLDFLILLATAIFMARLDYIHWRCPACGFHLGKSMVHYPKTCPRCKQAIDLNDKSRGGYWADQAKRGYPDLEGDNEDGEDKDPE